MYSIVVYNAPSKSYIETLITFTIDLGLKTTQTRLIMVDRTSTYNLIIGGIYLMLWSNCINPTPHDENPS